MLIPKVLPLWTVPAIPGVAAGSLLAAAAPAGLFKIAFATIAGVISAKMLLGRETWIIASDLPGRTAMRAYGFLMGLASSLMGISGGSFVTIFLTLFPKTIPQTLPTASRLGGPLTIPRTGGYAL